VLDTGAVVLYIAEHNIRGAFFDPKRKKEQWRMEPYLQLYKNYNNHLLAELLPATEGVPKARRMHFHLRWLQMCLFDSFFQAKGAAKSTRGLILLT
jgi:hypothetical protein